MLSDLTELLVFFRNVLFHIDKLLINQRYRLHVSSLWKETAFLTIS
jgi:hypothetical protein